MWYAKPSGAYNLQDNEAQANILEINGMLNGENYTLESQAGLLANSYAESGLNPWRWQMVNGHEIVNYSNGYGMYQFTPADDYFNNCYNMTGFAPNKSTSQQTPGALASDGYCQTNVIIYDTLHKWHSSCWRSYWDANVYPDLWDISQHILNTYGNGSTLTQNQFKSINNIADATFAFMACYEGQLVPSDYYNRVDNAVRIYATISGSTPVPPIPINPPTPPTSIPHRKLPIWMMIKRIH